MPDRLARHKPQATPTPRRASAHARGYGRRWDKLARWFKRRHPLCADPFGVHQAEGRVEFGEHVDHIVPRSRGGTDRASNLQTLCAACHSRKTVQCDGGFGFVQKRGETQQSGDEPRIVNTARARGQR
jgi:5-methylcytosine-specific restriction protein A